MEEIQTKYGRKPMHDQHTKVLKSEKTDREKPHGVAMQRRIEKTTELHSCSSRSDASNKLLQNQTN